MRYISENVISFSIKVKGREDSVRVNFLPLSAGGSSYSTEVTSVIEAMEKSPMFGKVYNRAPECMNEPVQPKKAVRTPKKKVSEVESVTTWQDAAEYLRENFAAGGLMVSNPTNIMDTADRYGVSFPNLSL